jgi:hypothetical protein
MKIASTFFLLLINTWVFGQINFLNSTNKSLWIAKAWNQDGDSGYKGFVSIGWYVVKPGETLNLELRLTKDTESIYLGIKDEHSNVINRSDFSFIVVPGLRVNDADKEKALFDNSNANWETFQEFVVSVNEFRNGVFTINYLELKDEIQLPVFMGTTYEDSGAMGDDQIDTWKYKSYIFKTITPGIARPIIFTEIYAIKQKELKQVKNNKLFGENVQRVMDMVNSKMKIDFLAQKKNDPNCYDEFYPLGINEVEISIDENYMYFSFIFDDEFLSNFDADCLYPGISAQINLSEISKLMVFN